MAYHLGSVSPAKPTLRKPPPQSRTTVTPPRRPDIGPRSWEEGRDSLLKLVVPPWSQRPPLLSPAQAHKMGGSTSKGAVWDNNIPDLNDKVALVTGANSGLGLETTRRLAACGATVVMACRNQDKANQAIEEIKRQHPAAKLEFLKVRW